MEGWKFSYLTVLVWITSNKSDDRPTTLRPSLSLSVSLSECFDLYIYLFFGRFPLIFFFTFFVSVNTKFDWFTRKNIILSLCYSLLVSLSFLISIFNRWIRLNSYLYLFKIPIITDTFSLYFIYINIYKYFIV